VRRAGRSRRNAPSGWRAHLDFAGRQFRVESGAVALGLRLEARRPSRRCEVAAIGKVPERLDRALQLGDRFFENRGNDDCGAFLHSNRQGALLRAGCHSGNRRFRESAPGTPCYAAECVPRRYSRQLAVEHGQRTRSGEHEAVPQAAGAAPDDLALETRKRFDDSVDSRLPSGGSATMTLAPMARVWRDAGEIGAAASRVAASARRAAILQNLSHSADMPRVH